MRCDKVAGSLLTVHVTLLQVVEHTSELAETSFGNYVIQSCLALCSDADRCAPRACL